MLKFPPSASIGIRLVASAVLASLWLTLCELAFVSLWTTVSLSQLGWVSISTLCLSLLSYSLLLLIELPLLCFPRLKKYRGSPAWLRIVIALLFLAGVALLQGLNAHLYVRLYLSIHLMMSLAAIVFAQLGFFLIVPAWPLGGKDTASRKPIALVTLTLVTWLVLLALSLSAITTRPALRTLALEKSTLLYHQLLLLDQVSGVLSAPDYDTTDVDQAQLDLLLPKALAPPKGLSPKANILLITVDSLRADRLAEMPQLAKLAANSISFSRAYSPSCWTVHSTWAFLSGKYASQSDYQHVTVNAALQFTVQAEESDLVSNPLHQKKVAPVPKPDNAATFVRALGDSGYQSATIASFLFQVRDAGITRDFDTIDESYWREHHADQPADSLTNAGLRVLNAFDETTPYFLWLHYMDPHMPYRSHEKSSQSAGPEGRYKSELRYVDRQLSRLIKTAVSKSANTIVVITADHGEEFREHGAQFHASAVYEESIHVPLVIVLPTEIAGEPRVIEASTSLIDLGPTLLDIVGVPWKVPVAGKSVVPLLLGDPMPPSPVIAECYRFQHKRRALIQWPYKLLINYAHGTVELFKLDEDPKETKNLVESEPATFSEMFSLLEAFRIIRRR